jgi:quercetin dioxygenase-like cupin family protein
MVQPKSVLAKDKAGRTHTPLLKSVLPGTSNEEVIVWDAEYSPRAVNPRHLDPAAIIFRVLSGTGIWQKEGKPPVTLHAGGSLLVPAGTIHSHWNPSASDPLRFLEFIVAEKTKDAGSSTGNTPSRRLAERPCVDEAALEFNGPAESSRTVRKGAR